MKKGDTVRSTGKGKSKSWGNYIGKVSRIEKEKVYVIWNNTTFEDEMSLEEVELIKNIHEVVELRFSDGMIIHTHGPLRIIELSDGWYLVGEGKLIPVKDEIEGNEILIRLSSPTINYPLIHFLAAPLLRSFLGYPPVLYIPFPRKGGSIPKIKYFPFKKFLKKFLETRPTF
jgi:hypothetical protein